MLNRVKNAQICLGFRFPGSIRTLEAITSIFRDNIEQNPKVVVLEVMKPTNLLGLEVSRRLFQTLD